MDMGSTLLLVGQMQAANAAAAQANITNNIASQQLAWAKQQWAESKAQNQPIVDRLVKGMDFQDQYAREQKAFWDQNYKGIEEDFARKASNYDTPERREQEAGAAAADVAQQFEGARQAAAQNLKDFGIDPTAPRYAATDLVSRIGQASASAGAQNVARRNVEQTGLGLEQAAINTGRGYPGAVNQTAGVGQNAGNSAVGNTNATAQLGSQMMTAPSAYYGLSNQAINTWGSGLNNAYGNYMQGYQADQQRSSGFGSMLGLAGGIAASAAMRAYAEGGAVYSDEGGAVPDEASPSGGAAVDDVPAMLNDGEFIMPKEAVSWFGEKTFHDMIIKAQKQRQETQAQSGAVPAMAPTNAQPEAALPVG